MAKRGRPVKYTKEKLSEIEQKIIAYTEANAVPILAECAYELGMYREQMYEFPELNYAIRQLIKKGGRSNKKKYDYNIGDSPLVARYNQDHTFRIKSCITARIRDAMIRNNIKGTTANKLRRELGYTIEELKIHLEKLFTDGMAWENYGKWHIDHIKPVACFNYLSTKDKEFKECWALGNLQPLWASDNIKKGCSYVETN